MKTPKNRQNFWWKMAKAGVYLQCRSKAFFESQNKKKNVSGTCTVFSYELQKSDFRVKSKNMRLRITV